MTAITMQNRSYSSCRCAILFLNPTCYRHGVCGTHPHPLCYYCARHRECALPYAYPGKVLDAEFRGVSSSAREC